MQIPIFQIKVNEGRRGADQKAVQDMADSISRVGLLNPITVDQEYILIAGLHRLEAAKRLGWAEIECTVSSLEGLKATLAEIDENFIHKDLSDVEFRELLLRRKEIYETLHPETKAALDNMGSDGSLRNGFVSAFGKYMNVEEITGEIASEVLNEVRIYPDKRLEIIWNFHDELEKLVSDLQGAQQDGSC